MTAANVCSPNFVSVVLGSQWGDEGKGKLIDLLSQKVDIVARCQGGANAGHTIILNGQKYTFHLLPSGILHSRVVGFIGNGVVIHLPSLFKEIYQLEGQGVSPILPRLKISSRAHIVFEFHRTVDGLLESEAQNSSIGTTKQGIGPTYSSKASRFGLRIGDLLCDEKAFKARYFQLLNGFYKRHQGFTHDCDAELQELFKFKDLLRQVVIDDGVSYLNRSRTQGKEILVEGANALLLDVDFGTYPFVTSSSCCIGGVVAGLAVHPRSLFPIIDVIKAYTTRVGHGPFPTELDLEQDPIGLHLSSVGAEYGTTTGRKRRCGWLDLVILSYSHAINHYDLLNLTKLDVLTGIAKIKIATAYRMKDGTISKDLIPSCLDDLPKTDADVIYHEMDGWNEPISHIREFGDLPENAKAYIQFIEDYIGVPIKWIGIGPSRDAMIARM
ncbi:Adenylosuccinate synthase [Mitosporidium daphniae]|uniref:Adenylosuccinate synthetase n=1 Tax=Mitosporidium daphniae TaxID=1485682 RepID=A0A098VWP3_9MICR|nr:adenylosuccinate synthetase [Mitosporidium daphniae]KGG52176.1 adenylosuccinate synthetase [Mitosporidium daphniae]|eukprot:XP_013238603.1 adenylosuccinate synthetase [Mitosporidium daphniae]